MSFSKASVLLQTFRPDLDCGPKNLNMEIKSKHFLTLRKKIKN